MRRHLFAACAASLLAASAGSALADGYGQGVPIDMNASVAGTMPPHGRDGAIGTKMVGGAPMYPTKDIVDNAVNSKDHTTLVAAVKAAGLVDTLKGPGPFTVFAPTNEAFAKLPAGTVDTLLKPREQGQAHPGADLSRGARQARRAGARGEIKAGGGKRHAEDGGGRHS